MSFPQQGGRTPNIQRGYPAMNMGGSRNQRRAYEFQQRQALERDWNQVRDFEPRPEQPRKPTARSQGWKEKQKEKKKPPQAPVDPEKYNFLAAEESKPIDEPMYDIGPHTSSIPIQELYSQNMEFSGYINQVERTYEALRGIDPRLDKRMPYSMFLHSMSTVLNCHLIDVTQANGENKIGPCKMQDLLPEDLCIPENLYHYLTNIGNTITATGEEIKFNLPDIAVPRAQEGNVPAGTFGPVNAQSHNVYECYISPLVTANRVLNSRRAPGAAEIPPLPAEMLPAGAIPTPNLLGHGQPDIIQMEARARIEGFNFPEGDSPSARLKICPELMSRVNTVLFELRNRYKMRDIGRSSPSLRNYIPSKSIPGNIQYVTVIEPTPDGQRLSDKQCQIKSSSSFGSSTAGQNNVHVLRRERTNNARGACYLINGAIPPGWQATINANFNMAGQFAPTIGVNNPAIRVPKFVSHAPGGLRTTAIDNYLKRNYYIPAR